MPECRIELLLDDSSYDPIVIFGDIAHIAPSSLAGPRGTVAKEIGKRDEYRNLILLCKNCHARIDGHSKKFTVEFISKIKKEHEAWVRVSLPEQQKSRHIWTTILLQGAHPIDPACALTALRPELSDKAKHILTVRPDKYSWQHVLNVLGKSVHEILDNTDSFERRFAVFPLAPVSACVALGYFLTDRPRVKLFQYHRHRQSWDWSRTSSTTNGRITVKWPKTSSRKRGQLVICVEISGLISNDQIEGVGSDLLGIVRIKVLRPSTDWLQKSDQIDSFGREVHNLFEDIIRRFPSASQWHLLVAAPAPIGVRIGQAMNPSVTPPVQLYEFQRGAIPPYSKSVVLGERQV